MMAKSYVVEGNVRFERSNGSVGYGKQCAMVRACDVEGGWAYFVDILWG